MPNMKTCLHCEGRGWLAHCSPELCSICHGVGFVRDVDRPEPEQLALPLPAPRVLVVTEQWSFYP